MVPPSHACEDPGRRQYGAPRGQKELGIKGACAVRPYKGPNWAAVQCQGGPWKKSAARLGPQSHAAEVRSRGGCSGFPRPDPIESSFRPLEAGGGQRAGRWGSYLTCRFSKLFVSAKPFLQGEPCMNAQPRGTRAIRGGAALEAAGAGKSSSKTPHTEQRMVCLHPAYHSGLENGHVCLK